MCYGIHSHYKATYVYICIVHVILCYLQHYKHPPLSHQVVTGRNSPSFTEGLQVSNTSRWTYRQWSSVNMQKAMEAVEKGDAIRMAGLVILTYSSYIMIHLKIVYTS